MSPRLPYADLSAAGTKDLVDSIVAQRGRVLELYQMLLHAPAVAEGWLRYMTAIRQKCRLAGDLRELAIIRIAHINGASYEAEQHVPFALREGVSQAKLDALTDWEASPLFTAPERAVLAYTDAMTKNVRVPDETFAAVRAAFDHQEIVELTATIASYNMVSRFLEALQIHAVGTKA